MAAYIQISEYWYIGASTDTKPTGVVYGVKCYEHDTKKWYITDDGSTWREMQDLDAIVLGAGSALIGKVGIDQTTPGTTNNVAVTGMGEVQASPTANTLLARVKDILTGIVLAAGTNVIGKVGHNVSAMGTGQKAVAAAGTAERLHTSSKSAKYTIVQALPANTTRVAIGDSRVDETPASVYGNILYPGEVITLPLDPYNIYCDPATSGQGVSFIYMT